MSNSASGNTLSSVKPVSITDAKLEDKQNKEKIITLLPPDLKWREEQLLSTFTRHQGNSLSKLKDLYSFIDEINSFVAKYTPCKKGCNHCCHIPVSVSSLEIEYIQTKIRKLRRNAPRANVKDYNSPCPFLVKGACSIYDVRPFYCRSHTALTANSFWCHPDRCNQISLTRLRFTEIDKVFEQLLFESGSAIPRIDIRAI